MAEIDKTFENLPGSAVEYINLVIKNMRYRKKARDEVREELIDHFELYLKDCATNEEKEQKAQRLISEFGDPKLLAKLMRRAKKRCRPLWQKIIVRSFAVALVIFAYLLICASWLRIGTPTIRINYAQWLTDRQKQGRDESLNARTEIEKAISLFNKTDQFPEIKWPGDMNDEQRAVTADFLKANAEAVDTLLKALQKPYYWVDYNAGITVLTNANLFIPLDAYLLKERLPFLSNFRMLAKSLALRALFNAYEGNIEQAIQDESSLFRLGYNLEGEGLLVEQLVAVAIEQLAHETTKKMLVNTQMSVEQLKQLQDTLENGFVTQKHIIDLNGEKALWYDSIQHIFTDDGKGNGKVLKNGLPFVVKSWQDALWKFVSFSYPDRAKFLADVELFFEKAQRLNDISPWDTVSYNLQWSQDNKTAPNFILMKILAPAYGQIYKISWRVKTQRESMLAILALLRFQKQTGHYPDQIDELVQNGFLKSLPIDPFSGSALTYKKTDEGFLLYSWGENLKDDNGQIARDEKGKIIQWAPEGDWVFWPVSKI